MSLQKIFFSYSRKDATAFALQLAQDLAGAGFNVWIDQQDIRAGLEWDLEIEKALESCDCLLFIESEQSVISNNVLDEVYYALGQNKKVIPVIYHDSKTPFRIQRLQHIDLSKNYEAGLVNLINELNGNIPDEENLQPFIPPASQQTSGGFLKKYAGLLIGFAVLAIAVTTAFFYANTNRKKPAAETTWVVTGDTINKITAEEPSSLPGRVDEIPVAENPSDKKNKDIKSGSLPATGNIKKTSPTSSAEIKPTVLPANLVETFAGNWQLVGVTPKPASHRGYLKIEEVDERRVKIVSNFQFYFKKTNAEARFVVFNGFASCASCILKNDLTIIEKDISFGTNRFTILKTDVPGEGKAGDTTASIGGSSTVSARVTLQLVNKNAIFIRVEQPASTSISNGFVVPPFVYLFHFKKSI